MEFTGMGMIDISILFLKFGEDREGRGTVNREGECGVSFRGAWVRKACDVLLRCAVLWFFTFKRGGSYFLLVLRVNNSWSHSSEDWILL